MLPMVYALYTNDNKYLSHEFTSMTANWKTLFLNQVSRGMRKQIGAFASNFEKGEVNNFYRHDIHLHRVVRSTRELVDSVYFLNVLLHINCARPSTILSDSWEHNTKEIVFSMFTMYAVTGNEHPSMHDRRTTDSG